MQDQYEIVNGLAFRTDLAKVYPRASEGSTADIVSILLLFVAQGFEVRLDCQGHNRRWIISEILLDCSLVELFEHF